MGDKLNRFMGFGMFAMGAMLVFMVFNMIINFFAVMAFVAAWL